MVYRESYINKLQQQCLLFKFNEGFIFYSLRSRPPSQKRGVGGGEWNKKTFLLVSPSQEQTTFNTLVHYYPYLTLFHGWSTGRVYR